MQFSGEWNIQWHSMEVHRRGDNSRSYYGYCIRNNYHLQYHHRQISQVRYVLQIIQIYELQIECQECKLDSLAATALQVSGISGWSQERIKEINDSSDTLPHAHCLLSCSVLYLRAYSRFASHYYNIGYGAVIGFSWPPIAIIMPNFCVMHPLFDGAVVLLTVTEYRFMACLFLVLKRTTVMYQKH